MQQTTALQKIRKARAALIVAQPFYGALALRLELAARNDIKTAATDGITLYFNPAWIDGLTMPELTGVVAHEVTHCAVDHISREGTRDHDRWNSACDYAINPELVAGGFVLPKGAFIDPAFTGMSADEIYGALGEREKQQQQAQQEAQQQPQPGQGATAQPDPQNGPSSPQNAPGNDPGGCGGMMQPPNPNGTGTAPQAQRDQITRDWKVATLNAAKFAKSQGTLPGSVSAIVDQVKANAIDWREVFRSFIKSATPENYSWTPPNRRHIHAGMYLPSMTPDRIGPVVVMVDTSGSCFTDAQLAAFSAELNGIAAEGMPESIHVVYCDMEINGTAEYVPDDYPITLAVDDAGGGTDFRPPFAWVAEQDIHPVCAVYLTDLDCRRFPEPPDYPVLWVSTRKTSAPFGEVLKLPQVF